MSSPLKMAMACGDEELCISEKAVGRYRTIRDTPVGSNEAATADAGKETLPRSLVALPIVKLSPLKVAVPAAGL